MPLPDYSLFGETLFRLAPDRTSRRAREVHTLQQRWQTPARDQFSIGDAPPGWGNMRIVALDPEEEIVDAAYDTRLDAEGILTEDEWIELEFVESVGEEGFDTAQRSIFTRAPTDALWNKGTQVIDPATAAVKTGYEYMFATSRELRQHRAKDYHTIGLGYKGIRGSKPYKRMINGAVASSSSKFSGYIILTDPVYENFPPTPKLDGLGDPVIATLAGEDIKVTYDAATISLVDTYLSNTAPPTEYIGQFWVPPDPPDVTIFTMSGEDTEYFYPFGWKCTGMPHDKIPGHDVWLISVHYMYQVIAIPTTLL